MYKRLTDQRIFMNTKVEFTTWSDMDRREIHKTFDKGFKCFHYVVENFSRFSKNSELSKLNRSKGKVFHVSKQLFQLIEFCLELAKKTNGAFDPTIIDLLEAYGYAPRLKFKNLENKKRLRNEIESILKTRPSYKQIELDKNELTIQLAARQRIDLGGVGKGYAIDLAYKELQPLKNFLINAGGDIRAKGVDRDKKEWNIGLKDPQLGQLKTIRLNGNSVCSSGKYARKVKFFHHLINPKTGKPQNKLNSIFVVAENSLLADGWATALFLDSDSISKHKKQENLTVYTVEARDGQISKPS